MAAILLSKASALRLGSRHQIPSTPFTWRTVSHHYVGDGSIPVYYPVGLRRLKATGFTGQLDRRA